MLSLSQAAVLIFAPTLYILLSCCALAQFRLLLHGLATAAWHAQRSPGLDTVAPVLRAFVAYLESIFGPAYKFVPRPTDVLLVALVIAVISHR